MAYDLGNVRRSQVITTSGPGAIVDFRAGSYGGAAISVVAAGLEEWDRWAPPPGLGNSQTVYEPRLQKKLGVDGFRLPPVAPQIAPGQYAKRAGRLVGVRFPRWLQCPTCHLVKQAQYWNEDAGDPALYCGRCSHEAGGRNRRHVVPVRFIIICEYGHLDEFPWEWWVKHKESCRDTRTLKLEGSATAGLAGLVLTCTNCHNHRTMEGCFGPEAIPQQCKGRRPWLGDDATEQCIGDARVVQRGASNIYYSALDSALDIPPWSDELQKKLGLRWAMLERAEGPEERRTLITALRLSPLTGKTENELAALIEDRVARLRAPDRNLRWEEYQQFIQHQSVFGERTEFEIRPSAPPPELKPWLRLVVTATRLREVRALVGFTRVFPPSADPARVARISARPLEWLPAVENRGEGIFLQLDEARISTWENTAMVTEHVGRLREAYRISWGERENVGLAPDELTPRFLLVHSLAHALIRQIALSSGYGMASLRERLYVDTGDWDMAALLIFTSSPDADGTLGGLARQAHAEFLIRVFGGAFASQAWCSSDPLCIEGVHALSQAANGAACHACLLAPETSCEQFNSFLDRALLVGTPETPQLGFFHDFLAEAAG